MVSLGDKHVMFRGIGIKYIVIVKEFGICKSKVTTFQWVSGVTLSILQFYHHRVWWYHKDNKLLTYFAACNFCALTASGCSTPTLLKTLEVLLKYRDFISNIYKGSQATTTSMNIRLMELFINNFTHFFGTYKCKTLSNTS